MLPDQNSRQAGPVAVPDEPETIPGALRKARLKMVVEGTMVLALAFSVIAIQTFAQSSSLPSSQSASPPPTLQTSLPGPKQQTSAAAVIPSATTVPPEYRVGMGDVLGITVYNMPELDRTAVVGSGGTILLSYLTQPLDVNGKTAQEIGQEVGSELKRLQVLIDPQVSVAVVRVESKPVVVGGDVRNPQVLQEIRPFRLLDVLMLAGGPGNGAGDSVLVTRTDSKGRTMSYDLPLSKVMSGTDPAANIAVQPGDTIQVLPGQRVFVAGDVKNPGAFPLGRGQQLTISKLMALTGGWKANAKPGKAVIVRQEANGQRTTVPLNLPKIMARKKPDVTLEANDLVYVPGSTEKTVGLAAIKGVGGAVLLGLGYLIIRP